MNGMIRTENISKRFRSTSARNQVTFTVPEGAIYALLGAHGAGKTTLIKLLSTYLLIAQCLLLFRAGFRPLSLFSGLLFKLLLITVVLVLPLLAITTVTATFARLTLTLFVGLVCFIGYVAVSLYFSDEASILSSNRLSLPLALLFCGTVVVLQYAARRVWVSRLLLIALPFLLVVSGMAVSESTVMDREYPRGSAGQKRSRA